MRTSCNGCRVLRKGCSDDCVIRPCLQWLKSGDAQANATVFLAKFYGRAGLLNLLNAGPDHLRPAIFQSLLYEACGRVVDPIYGSVGLLYSGQWHHCQLAVDAVLKGLPIMPLSPPSDLMTSSSDHHQQPPSDGPSHQIILPPNFKLYDIHHMSLSKDLRHPQRIRSNATTVPALVPTRPRGGRVPAVDSDQLSINGGDKDEAEAEGEDDHSVEKHSIFSGESTDGSMAGQVGESEVELDLTLGFNKYSNMRR